MIIRPGQDPPPPPPRKAALHMRKGEQIHIVATTPWVMHKGARICWRIISKKRLDSRIEAMHFIAQATAGDMVSAHVVLPAPKLGDFLKKCEQAIQVFVPELRLESGPLTKFDEAEFGPYFLYDPDAYDRLRAKADRWK